MNISLHENQNTTNHVKFVVVNLRPAYKLRYVSETIDSEKVGAYALMTENKPHLFEVNCCEASRSEVKRVVNDGSSTPIVARPS